MGKVCDMDCFHCKFEDCIINDEDIKQKERSAEYKEYQRQWHKRVYDENKEKGICVVCRKRPTKYGVRCYECHLTQKRRNREKAKGLKVAWKEKGLCSFCGAEVIPGKKVCEKHYKFLMKNVEKMWNHENTKNARNEQRKWIESFFQ